MGKARRVVLDDEEWKDNPKAWVWCLHCERCYQVEAAVSGDCPYADCDGCLSWDGWQYSRLQREAHREWPRVPVLGAVYSIY